MSCFKRVFFLGLFLVTQASAWNYGAHVLVGQIAFDQLSPRVQEKLGEPVKALWAHLPEESVAEMNKFYPDPQISLFAKTLVLADQFKMLAVFKRRTLEKTLIVLNIVPPKWFKPYLQERTNAWHFFNMPVSRGAALFQCHIEEDKRSILWAIKLLQAGAKKKNTPEQHGLILALLGHFVGDAHQPLHFLDAFDSHCHGDMGAITFCLSPPLSGYCKKNLHVLWDGLLGLTAYDTLPKRSIPDLAKEIEKEFPLSTMSVHLKHLNTQDWLLESLQYAPFIYNTPIGVEPNEAYYRVGRLIAKQKIALAGYRLAKMINLLYGD